MRSKPIGFTLLEIVVVVAIITLLAAFILPAARGYIDSSKAAKILAVADTLKSASLRFYHDTNVFPVESSGSPGNPFVGDKTHHHLSITQTTADIPGWDGPYIDHELCLSDNPYSDLVALYEEADRLGIDFNGVSESVGKLVDEKLDAAEDPNWQVVGLVLYAPAEKKLQIKLLQKQ